MTAADWLRMQHVFDVYVSNANCTCTKSEAGPFPYGMPERARKRKVSRPGTCLAVSH
jgi:hypothetical protein